ncbi:glycosyltransferase 87 family protein [Singulisphaera sp. PoT]|uniref:glycosyltransferase 87 family protein n=1 Tax=Singulisphaera sp. PoT TaxID=3411797 RepID=UPI003BF5FFBD
MSGRAVRVHQDESIQSGSDNPEGSQAPSPVEPKRYEPKTYLQIFALFGVLAIIFSIAPASHVLKGKKNKDYPLWYETGRKVVEGKDIYPKDHRPFPFMYPPSCAAMLAMATFAGEVPFVFGLIVLNTAAWLTCILLSVYLATGHAWRQHPLLYLVPSLCVIPFVSDMYLLGQPNLFLLALMLGALACLRLRHPVAAGALVAVAAAVKAFPVMGIGYLVYRRQWKATAAMVGFLTFLLLVLPAGFRGPARAWDDMATWTRGMVLKYDQGSIAQRPDRSYSYKNQSMMALVNRLFRPVLADGEADRTWRVNVADLGFKGVNAVILGVAALLCLFYIGTMPSRAKRTDRTDAIEGSMLLLMIVFFSPLSFNYFYVWLICPLTIALSMVLEAPEKSRERTALAVWMGTSVFLLALAIPFLRGSQAYGNLFFAALILMVGLGLRMRRITSLGRVLGGNAPSLGAASA